MQRVSDPSPPIAPLTCGERRIADARAVYGDTVALSHALSMAQIAEQRKPASQVQRKARPSTLPADSLQHSLTLPKAFYPRHDSSRTVICRKAVSSPDESEILQHRCSRRPASLTLLLLHRSGSTVPALPLVLSHEHS